MIETIRNSIIADYEAKLQAERQRWESKIELIQQQHGEALEQVRSKEKSRGIGEQQVKFNEALKKAMAEKDKELAGVIRRNQSLQDSLDSLVQTPAASAGPQLELSSEMKQAMEMSMNASTIAINEFPMSSSCSEVQKLRLENQLLKEQLTRSMTSIVNSGKISVVNLEVGDIVLVFFNEEHGQYMIYTESPKLYFLNMEESASELGLVMNKRSSTPRSNGDAKDGANNQNKEAVRQKRYLTAEIVDKDFCQARKQGNRFNVAQGTRFYRVKCKRVDKEALWLSSQSSDQKE